MRRRGAVSAVGIASVGLLGACVTVYEDAPLFGKVEMDRPEFAVAQTIPLGAASQSGDQRALFELYDGVFKRLASSLAERDLAGMRSLLDAYERQNLPPWVVERLDGFRSLAHGLAFQMHAAATSSLQVVRADGAAAGAATGAAPAATTPAAPLAATEPRLGAPLGEPLRIEFVLPAPASPVRLGGRDDDDPIGFYISLTIEDAYATGGTRQQKDQDFVWLPESFDLKGDAVLRVPIALDVPGGAAVQRTVHVRVDLLPGYIGTEGRRAFVQRAPLAAMSLTQWPPGADAIAEKPLATLRQAQRLGDAAHFRHVWLGAVFTTGADRETALSLLIDQVRFGSQPQATVAMAALRAMSGAELTIGEREAWLAWWQMRR